MNGEGGIRTLDGGIHPHNALAGRRLQPLGHFSGTGMVSQGVEGTRPGKSPFGGMTEACRPRTMRQPDFPPHSPRHLRRPFSAATGSGRFSFWDSGKARLKVCAHECRNEWSGRRGSPTPLPGARARLPRAARACARTAAAARRGRALRRRPASCPAARGAATARRRAAAAPTATASSPAAARAAPGRRCRLCDRGAPRRSRSRCCLDHRDRRRRVRPRALSRAD